MWNASRQDVGNDTIRQCRDFVLEHQLALFQSCNLDLIDRSRNAQRLDLLIEPTMFGLQQRQYLLRIIIVHAPGLAEVICRVTKRSPRLRGDAALTRDGWSQLGETKAAIHDLMLVSLSLHGKEHCRWITDIFIPSRTSTRHSMR